MARKAKTIKHPFVKIDNDYKGNTVFPDRSIDPALKGEDYCRKWAKAIYSTFVNDRSSWGVSMWEHMNLMRLYAIGDQPVDQYQRTMLNESEDEGTTSYDVGDMPISRVAKREGWLNVLWKPLSLAPKIINNILGMMEGVDFDIFVDAIDSNSRDIQATAKAKARVLSMNKEFLSNFKQNAGIPTNEEDSVPDNPYELDIIESMDGFKVNYAKGMQQIVRHSMDISKWDDVLYKKLVTDLCVVRRCATRDYYNPESKKFETKYIDVARAGVQYSNDLDFTDSEYAYYCDLKTISELRVAMPWVSEKELFHLAEANYGLFGNPNNIPRGTDILSNPDILASDYPWNDFYISVFEVEWMDTDTKRSQEYTNRYGKTRFVPLKFNEDIMEVSERDRKRGISAKEITTGVRQPYMCSWVVGTDYVFNTGKTYFAARPQPSKPKLSFHFEQLLEPSIIEIISPILDQFQITWYKYQNLRAQAIESGFAVDFGMLINLTDGDGKKYPLDEILKMWKQTGILPFMSSRFGSYQGGAVTPVSALPNNLLDGIQGIQADFNVQFQLLEQLTGINPVALGQSPNPEAPVSTTEAALQSTVNVLKPIATGVREIKENIATNLMAMVQSGIKADTTIEKSYAFVVGATVLQYIKDAEKEGAQYGMRMEAKPDQLFKRNIAEYVKIALQNGRDGKAGLDIPQAMLIDERMLRNEDIAQLRQDITYFIERSKKELDRKKKEDIMLQGQVLQQQEQMKQQGQAQLDRGKAMVAQVEEAEKRKTKRMEQNYQFINKLMDTVQREQQDGNFNSQTISRLNLALKAAGYMDMAQVDLPSEVARLEGAQPMMSNAPAGEQTPTSPTFPPMSAPAESAMM